jgi:hypothetical protein
MVGWPVAFGPVVKTAHHSRSMCGAKWFASWLGNNRERKRKGVPPMTKDSQHLPTAPPLGASLCPRTFRGHLRYTLWQVTSTMCLFIHLFMHLFFCSTHIY